MISLDRAYPHMPFPIERPVVFPLFGITPDGKCACGTDSCSRVGKHPAILWRDVEYGSAVPRPEPGAGVGLKTGAAPRGSGVFVVDLDGEDACEAWGRLGPEAQDTYTVQTPRGWHLYFRHPGFPVPNSAGDLAKGIDIRGDGGFVVAPGSPHRSGGTYLGDEDGMPLGDAPSWLLEWLSKQKAPIQSQTYPGDVTDPAELDRRRGVYTSYLRDEAPPCVKGSAGDQTLFEVVQRGAYDLALPVDDVLELVRDVYDPRCSPPWGDELEERVHHKARDAKESSTRPRAEPLPADLAHLTAGTSQRTATSGLVSALADYRPIDTGIASEMSASEVDALEADLKVTWGGWLQPMPPPVYVIAPIVPEATLGVIVAKGSSLKTWLVVSMLSAVARGRPWLDHFAVIEGTALLVDFESGRDIIQERVQYLRTGDAPAFGIASFPRGRIDDPAFWAKLAKLVIARGVKLLAIDSFANGAIGVDENDAKSALPLQFATAFIELTKCAVVLIHHAKKGEGGDERDLVRGSGAIYGAADWVYTMIPQDEDRTKMLVRCIKAFRKKTDDFRVALTVDGLVLDTSEVPDEERSEEIRARIKGALARGPIADRKLIHKALGKKNGFCSAEIDALVTLREIVSLPGKGYVLDYPVARLERIKAAAILPASSAEALARHAHVDADEVLELLKDGSLSRSGNAFVFTG